MKEKNKFFLTLILIFFLSGCESNERQSSNSNKPKSIEHKLAVLDSDDFVSENDLSVKRFRSLLSQLSQKFIENEEEIGTISYNMKIMLKEEGISESLLNIMTGMNLLISSKEKKQKYKDYAWAYVTLRTEGQSHSEAVNGLRALLQNFGVF